ncbi:MAG: acyltransferase family protein [Actinomycetaceae bacterium]|nr:acyltransferase family protein [Actinomycetaceae bacterium]
MIDRSTLPPRASPEPALKAFHDRRSFRTELHGVRGLAIALVVTFHIFSNGRVSGGIDIFLAITGFLAIPSLMRRAEKGKGFIPLGVRFAGLVRRLWVPLAPMLIIIALAGTVVLPLSSHPQLFREFRASSLFYENYELIRSQLSYNAAGPDTSPLQHLWSTSIQVQFHILMPFIVMAVTVPFFYLKRNPRPAVLIILTGLTVWSMMHAIEGQQVHQAENYFSTVSRTWQLTLPGIVGLTIDKMRINSLFRAILSWIGLILMCSAGFIFDGGSLYPSYHALVPVGAMLLIVIAGDTRSRWGADRILGLWPFQKLGDISYSLYIWHWPLIVLYLNYSAQDTLDLFGALSILLISLCLAYLGKRFLEDGLAQAPLFIGAHWRRPLTTGIVGALLMGSTFWYLQHSALWEIDRLEAAGRADFSLSDYPGAQAFVADAPVPEMPVFPDLNAVPTNWGEVFDLPPINTTELDRCWGEGDDTVTDPVGCAYGNPESDKTVAMVGGSHVGQWWRAFKNAADDYDWQLILLQRGGCVFTIDPEPSPDEPVYPQGCYEYNRNALDYLLDIQPDLVVTGGTTQHFKGREGILEGMRDAWVELEEAEIPTLLLRDTQRVPDATATCLMQGGDAISCGTPRSEKYLKSIDENGLSDLPTTALFLDTSQFICKDDYCPAIIGNVAVWRGQAHITYAYAQTIRPTLEPILRDFVPELYE